MRAINPNDCVHCRASGWSPGDTGKEDKNGDMTCSRCWSEMEMTGCDTYAEHRKELARAARFDKAMRGVA